MLKKTSAIIISAWILCSMAACSAQSDKSSASTSQASVSIADTNAISSSGNGTESSEDDTTVDIEAILHGSDSPADQNSGNTAPQDTGSAANDISTTGRTKRSFQNSTPQDGTAAPAQPTFPDNVSDSTPIQSENGSDASASANTVSTASDEMSTDELFSSRDLEQSPDLSSAKTIQVSSNNTDTITEAGIYILTGNAENYTVRIEAGKEDKVQLVLDNLTVTNTSTPVIYVVSADKAFVTTASGESTLSVTGAFTADGDTNTDAVIFSKDDIVFNGTGSLNIVSANGNGISGKDDMKFTGGTYNITSALDSIEANDSISIYDGSFTIRSGKDGMHSEDSDDDTVGWICIKGGSFSITASSDAIQAMTLLQIDGGSFDLSASEGLEATYIRINDGNVNINASDDGINAARKSNSFGTPTIEFNGGNITVAVGQGNTDAIDANGNIIVNGGTINVTAQMSSFDYDGTAQYNGGTIIINGTQVDSIPQSMMGGGRMGGMNGMNGRMNRSF